MTDMKDGPNPGSFQSSLASSIYGALGIGLMVGALMGLAKSAVVGAFIGAVGTALAALLGLSDKHFSTKKAVRIGTFGFAVLVAAPASLYVRDHGLLTPQPPPPQSNSELLAEYLALGFEKAEALELVGLTISQKAEQQFASAGPRKSYLHSSKTNSTTCKDLGTLTATGNEQVLADSFRIYTDLYDADKKKWGLLLDSLTQLPTGKDRKALLFLARDADCARDNFSARVALDDRYCAEIASGGAPPLAEDYRAAIEERLNEDFTEEARRGARSLLIAFLCR